MRFLAIFNLFFYGLFTSPAFAQEDFNVWLNDLTQEALSVGVTEKTVSDAVNHIEILPNIIQLDRDQPEFVSPFLDYYQRRVNALKINEGRKLLVQHADLLDRVEQQYGVPKALLVAFWGMESNYGRYQGNIDTLSALATLAYDGRRASFFRNQLIDAMRMVDAGNANVEQFIGSWAGAFGNMQFMPTTFITYAVDGDGDKKIDVVNSYADAFASAANYLSQVGWKNGQPAMLEVQLPADFEWQKAQYTLRKPISEWLKLGVTTMQAGNLSAAGGLTQARSANIKIKTKKYQSNIHQINFKSKKTTASIVRDQPVRAIKSTLPNVSGQAAIILPQGWRGPAFMVFDNFDAVMDWNRSINYALSVVQLAKRLNGEPHILGGQFAELGALSFQQMKALQVELNNHGFDAGEPDGFPGVRTQEAVRAFQLTQRLPADGYASPNIFNYLKAAQ
ncbi:MAG: lytic murein transglycosylase [Methylotenera sp.]|uniref:lytic murein transglycosylase n=1 Tax=Methylotenera sp. TaxID=2051956 RepID=UPI002487EDEB|nr:lytic murein transglycosylase [Methylotenera sp.]MDI1308482.1 lytic murein transglycosylase [Methylotenera sp.]